MQSPYPLRTGEPDCRDFLRTGRCKYGESCKYNHPPNVESGGGVKPLDPLEPLYPVRPNEPPCQYFLKHGSCKFGQSCKFNHPSGTPVNLADGSSNNLPSGLVFVTSNAPGSGDSSSHQFMASSAVQILPQRPSEPDCIYFLRNGRCKYGATCKFHHPLDSAGRNQAQQQLMQSTNARHRDRSHSFGSASEGRSQAHNVTYGQSRLQPITERARQHTHILLPDGQIALILDPQSLQNVSELNAQDRPKFYISQANGSSGTSQTMQSMEQNPVVVSPMLTSTSASSSHQTFESSVDLWSNTLSSQYQSGGTQHRGPNNQSQANGTSSQNPNSISYYKTSDDFDNGAGSGGSLSAYGSVDSGPQGQGDYAHHHSQHFSQNQGQGPMPQHKSWSIEISDGDLSYHPQQRRSPSSNNDYRDRANSVGNATEQPGSYYWPSAGSLSRQSNVGKTDSADVGLPVYDQPSRGYDARFNPHQYNARNSATLATGQGVDRSHSFERHPTMSPSSKTEHGHYSGPADQSLDNRRRAEQSSGDDDGLSMMTSALLTMMDRHSPSEDQQANARMSTNQGPPASPHHGGQRMLNHSEKGYYHSEPNMRERESPMQPMPPPPGMTMMSPSRMSAVDAPRPFHPYQDISRSRSPPDDNYNSGGYSQTASWTQSWSDQR